jgi:hypothetical protein
MTVILYSVHVQKLLQLASLWFIVKKKLLMNRHTTSVQILAIRVNDDKLEIGLSVGNLQRVNE